jgi:hypothetical protein
LKKFSIKQFVFICIVIFRAGGFIEVKIFQLVDTCFVLLMQNMKLFVSQLALL